MLEQSKDIRYYINILKKRKKLFIFPALAISLVAIAVALLLPSIYESSSTILIEEQQIPPDFVRSTVTGFADQRIQSLTQQILSRSKLKGIVEKFNLYAEMKGQYTQEEIIKTMRNDIKIDTIGAEESDKRRGGGNQPGVTIAFKIAYRGKNPATLQNVVGMLASFYLEQNLKIREAQAQSTTQFLEAELKNLKEQIRSLGEKMTHFKETHEGMLPELYQFNMGQTDRLETEVKQIDVSLHAAEERKIYLEGQLNTLNPDLLVTGDRAMDPRSRLRALEVSLADLQSKFSEDHPDLRKVRREMAELKKQVGSKGSSGSLQRQKLVELKANLAQTQGKYSDEHPEVKKLKNEIAFLEKQPKEASSSKAVEPENPNYISLSNQIQGAISDIGSLRKQRSALQEKLQLYRHRLEEGPKAEQEYLSLQRDYANAHAKHQEVMNKILESRISEGMEAHQKAEKFTLIEPASHPETPVQPKRLMICAFGVFFGLIVGFGAVALADNLDHSVKSADELAQLGGVPVLGSISRISTTGDEAWARSNRKLIWMATGLVIVVGLIIFHFLYMDLWLLTSKLFRLAHKYS